jgi:hypothetical protein
MESFQSTPSVSIRTSAVATVTLPMRPPIANATWVPSGETRGSRTGSLVWVSRLSRSFGRRRQ